MRGFPHLSGLLGLADKHGVDIQPTLLRVLTDLYVQKPSHSTAEEQHYTELALRLIEIVDNATREAVLTRLASYRGAPELILRRLSALLAGNVTHGKMPAFDARDHVPSSASTNSESSLDRCLGLSLSRSLDESLGQLRGHLAQTASPPPAYQANLSEIFFAADSNERQLILMALDYAQIPLASMTGTYHTETIRVLENAALARNVSEFIRTLSRAMMLAHTQAARIVSDATGEPLIVAAKALDIPADILQRIVLFLNPAIGQSVQRVYDLATLYDQITRISALRLVEIWRQAGVVASTKPAYRPANPSDDKRGAREIFTPPARQNERIARIPVAHQRRSTREN